MAIFKRGGIWQAHFFVNGKRYRQSLGTGDWRDASQLEKDLIGKAREGKLAPSGMPFARLKFSDAVERYLEDRQSPRIKAKTVQTEKERGRIVKARLGDFLLRKITSEVVNGYMRERTRQGMANGSVNRELDIIRGVLKRAKLWGPMSDDVKSLPPGDEVGRALTYDEKVRLEKIAKERPEWQSARLAMTLAVNTTMRASEIRNLRWRDIDFFEKEVTVQRSKTKAGERTIPLNKDALGCHPRTP